jgi:BMFP domain-containing protein YqiC
MMKLPPKDSDRQRKAMAAMGPQAIDTLLRQAIQTIWMTLPEERRNPEEVEKLIRELLERALKDFHSDYSRFKR